MMAGSVHARTQALESVTTRRLVSIDNPWSVDPRGSPIAYNPSVSGPQRRDPQEELKGAEQPPSPPIYHP